MKFSKKAIRITAATLSAVLACGTLTLFAGCGPKDKTLVIMTEDLNGLYNPFYASAGTDMDVTGQTQISMLSTDKNGKVAYGEDEPTVVLDYKMETEGKGTVNETSVYYFVLKNGIKFSDGKPLTMNDVLFNMYVYLDPTYAGSSTMYSTKIEGLATYRTQQNLADSGKADDATTETASGLMEDRVLELINVYKSLETYTGSGVFDSMVTDMRDAISKWTPSEAYKEAIWSKYELSSVTDAMARAQLLDDYNYIVGKDTTVDKNNSPKWVDASGKELKNPDKGHFYEELETDFNSAKDAYKDTEPYKSQGVFNDPVVSFLFMEGFITVDYDEDPITHAKDKTTIKEVHNSYDKITTKEQAINLVWAAKTQNVEEVLLGWATGSSLQNEFMSQAKDVVLHNNLDDDGKLIYPNISGIRSLSPDHQPDGATEVLPEAVTIGGKTYDIAQSHNEDGTTKSDNEYDVLRIRVTGTDPKAIWNFGFTVAPYHYYSDPAKYPMNIAGNEFGVEWASFNFQTKVIQGNNANGVSKNSVPMGAGPYVATDSKNGDNPTAEGFYNSNIVFYKSNKNFLMGEPKIEKMRYRVVSSGNAIAELRAGTVHFVEPQFTQENQTEIKGMKSVTSVSTWNLGYGYIGINAGKVPNVYLRRAIMAAMDISLALDYYAPGTVSNIYWPMSIVNWAYPAKSNATSRDPDRASEWVDNENGHDEYTNFPNYVTSVMTDEQKAAARAQADEEVKETIRGYMRDAKVSAGDTSGALKITLTIAGSSLTEHPCYNVFKHAMDLLNACGWDVELIPDTNALIKLATGSLQVWAAAWGSTLDPDMYQVYHKNSTATSVLAWGYREIKANTSKYSYENGILNSLSDVIDDARRITDEAERTALYKTAMGYVLDLAVELPVYQRQVMYAFNHNVIDESTLQLPINPYSSPLGRIWEVNFVGASEK